MSYLQWKSIKLLNIYIIYTVGKKEKHKQLSTIISMKRDKVFAFLLRDLSYLITNNVLGISPDPKAQKRCKEQRLLKRSTKNQFLSKFGSRSLSPVHVFFNTELNCYSSRPQQFSWLLSIQWKHQIKIWKHRTFLP